MIGLFFILSSLILTSVWLLMFFSGNRTKKVVGLQYETIMFLSIGAAVVGTVFVRIGI